MTAALVIGSGALGGAIVRAWLSDPNTAPEQVRVLSRHPRPVAGVDPDRIGPMAGSITDAAAVRTALDGVAAALAAADAATGLTFEVCSRPGPAVSDWPGVFAGLHKDAR